MLHLRLTVSEENEPRVEAALEDLKGVERLARWDAVKKGEAILSADVDRRAADVVVDVLASLDVTEDDFVLMRQEIVAPATATTREGAGGSLRSFSWLEVLGEARAYSRPLGRYLIQMAAAGVVAAIGVITKNPILIVGGMAVSPDLLPICSTCVGIVLRRGQLVLNAFSTLVLGLVMMIVLAIGIGAMVVALNWVPDSFEVGDGGMRTLGTLHYSTIAVALVAGIVAILSFETRAASAVGVAISVATVPASVYAGVAIGAGEANQAGEALLTLAVNVVLLIFAGSITLMLQRRLTGGFSRSRHPDAFQALKEAERVEALTHPKGRRRAGQAESAPRVDGD
ncbi:MAG: DUF389 domain-containing protein [Solirubrobacterales bacterium]